MLLTYLILLVLLQTQFFLLLKSKNMENRERNDSRISGMIATDSEDLKKNLFDLILEKNINRSSFLNTPK